MPQPTELSAILERIANGEHTEADLQTLRDLLNQGDRPPSLLQVGKYSVNIQQALGEVHIGDRLELTEENIQAIAQAIREEISKSVPSQSAEIASVDELVQQVRSRIHNDIQRLHGTMPLWGVDHWVPLGELFVDVNILEELSSSHRAELADLWQDFSQNPGYRGLDRMGLGKERQRVSGLEVLDRNTNLMVVGKPGSGKTTYLQRVVTECNVGNLQAHRIPVLIRLREFVDDGREVGYAVERYLEQCWQLSDQAVQLVLGEGRSLVLLDGLDEVTGTDGPAIAKQIKRFARDYPQVQVIVTCRTQSQESRFARFDYVEVADFNEPQVRAFTEHWFQTVCRDLTVGQTKATAFLDQLFRWENKPIRELAITPILLSLTCAVFQQTGKFYSKRSKLYEEGLELLLEQWDKSREIERDEIYRDLSVERKLELLSYLAAKKFEQKQYVLFEQTEIERNIAEFLGIELRESRGVLRAIESQHGLLIERSTKIWSFSHLTFQEFLVAKDVSSNLDSFLEKDISTYISNRKWREALLLTAEILPSSDIFLQSIRNSLDTSIKHDLKLQEYLNSIHQVILPCAYIKSKITSRMMLFIICLSISDSYQSSSDMHITEVPATVESYLPIIEKLDLEVFQKIKEDIDINSSEYNYLSSLDERVFEKIKNGSFIYPFTFLMFREVAVINNFSTLQDFISISIPSQHKISIFLNQCDILHRLVDFLVTSNGYNPLFLTKIESLISQAKCFNQENGREFERWINKDANQWISALSRVIAESTFLGVWWFLSDEQWGIMRNYYDLNNFLLECLSSSSQMDSNLKQKIEESLLMPSAFME